MKQNNSEMCLDLQQSTDNWEYNDTELGRNIAAFDNEIVGLTKHRDHTHLLSMPLAPQGRKAISAKIISLTDLSTRPFIPVPRFFHSRRATPLLVPSLVLFTQQST